MRISDWSSDVCSSDLMAIVVVDPRRTMTAEAADLHLALKPGTDVALFNGLLAHLAASQASDGAFIAQHTAGLDAALAALDGAGLAETAAVTGLPEIGRASCRERVCQYG